MVRVRRKKEKKKNRKDKSPNGGNLTTYDPTFHPEVAENICKQFGAKMEELAEVFGISIKTLELWTRKHEELKEAIKRGRYSFDSEKVVNALLKRALGYEYEEVTTKEIRLKQKDEDGETISYKPAREIYRTKKHIPADPKSIFFWLQNREPEEWKNTRYIDIKKTDKKKIKIEQKLTLEQLREMSVDDLRVIKRLHTSTRRISGQNISREIAN